MNKELLAKELQESIQNGDTQAFINQMVKWAENAEEKMLEKFNALQGITDEQILASRGVYSLTSEENTFYNSLVDSVQNNVTNFEISFPVTTINRVYEEIKTEHPLLSKIDFINNQGLTEWLITSDVSKLATWGDLVDTITAENSATIARIQFAQFKLSAYMPIPKTAVELGLTWLDVYVRAILTEAIAYKLEDAIINGTGQKMPVGMMKTVNIAEQPLPAVDKTATKITDLGIKTLGTIAKELTNGGKRKVGTMLMIVNPLDYYDKVLPAVTMQTANGEYVQRFALPVDVVESVVCPEGKAIFGIAKNYFATLGLGKEGKIEHSDHYKFLEDVRTYKTKLVSYGTPKDNASFVVRNIADLEEATFKIVDVTPTTA